MGIKLPARRKAQGRQIFITSASWLSVSLDTLQYQRARWFAAAFLLGPLRQADGCIHIDYLIRVQFFVALFCLEYWLSAHDRCHHFSLHLPAIKWRVL